MENIIDAQGKTLGRLASGAAAVLRGKSTVSFERQRIPGDVTVKILNAKEVRISGNKKNTKHYDRYSGYPGGLRSLSFASMTEQHGAKKVIEKAIHGMLPKNKLRPLLMKKLTILE